MPPLIVDHGLMDQYVETLGAIGRNADGVLFRSAYSAELLAARDLIAEWMQAIGLDIRVDSMGVLWGRLEGDEGGAPVVSGSHLDTVRDGGKLDGALGVLAALMAVRVLKEQRGRPRRTVEVVGFPEEEGSRFPAANCLTTRAITGALSRANLDRIHDGDGISVAEAMRAVGLDPDRLAEARRTDIGAFLELHIEQGPMLESKGLSVGIVSSIAGGWWEQIHVYGRPDHAGATAMTLRQDALVAAAEMIVEITRTVEQQGAPAVATIGTLQVSPGVTNVIPGEVTFTIDARHSEPAGVEELQRRITAAIDDVAHRRGRRYERTRLVDKACVPMHPKMIALLEDVARDYGIPAMTMPSAAGHDAMLMAPHWPTGMIFVMSRGGRSHCPDEYTPISDIVKGVQVLAGAIERLAY